MVETPADMLLESAPRSSTAPYRWPPEAEDRRSRAPEFYGFVAWTSTYLLFVLYVLWAVLPDEWIVWTGVTWYPNREWSLLVPAWTIVLVITTYVSYSALAIRAQPAFDDMCSITDSRISLPARDLRIHNPYTASAREDAVPELYDIPIGLVNRVLYRDVFDRVAQNRKGNKEGLR